tara:strand:- start:3330 stop:4064 length:735 start_codon:yes stop_codon:yes gene_type:complete
MTTKSYFSKKNNKLIIFLSILLSIVIYFQNIYNKNIYKFNLNTETVKTVQSNLNRNFYFLINTLSNHTEYDPNDAWFLEKYYTTNAQIDFDKKRKLFKKFIKNNEIFKDNLNFENANDYFIKRNDFFVKYFGGNFFLFSDQEQDLQINNQVEFTKKFLVHIYYTYKNKTDFYYRLKDQEDFYDQKLTKLYHDLFFEEISFKKFKLTSEVTLKIMFLIFFFIIFYIVLRFTTTICNFLKNQFYDY